MDLKDSVTYQKKKVSVFVSNWFYGCYNIYTFEQTFLMSFFNWVLFNKFCSMSFVFPPSSFLTNFSWWVFASVCFLIFLPTSVFRSAVYFPQNLSFISKSFSNFCRLNIGSQMKERRKEDDLVKAPFLILAPGTHILTQSFYFFLLWQSYFRDGISNIEFIAIIYWNIS